MKKLIKLVISTVGFLMFLATIIGIIDRENQARREQKGKKGHKFYGPYEKYFKRPLDFFLSIIAILVLSPLLVLLTLVGAFKMKGNPFFIQERPGRDKKIFKLIKFRTMTHENDNNGNPLPDEERIVPYGQLLRRTSLDELPELFNIVKGDLSIVGPRPLLVRYLPFYNEIEQKRHDIRPGLTGLAQIHGRNVINWDKKFEWDLKYVDKITFRTDVKVIIDTVKAVFHSDDVRINALEDFDVYRKKQDQISNAAISDSKD